jgi:hypothetical protein
VRVEVALPAELVVAAGTLGAAAPAAFADVSAVVLRAGECSAVAAVLPTPRQGLIGGCRARPFEGWSLGVLRRGSAGREGRVGLVIFGRLRLLGCALGGVHDPGR